MTDVAIAVIAATRNQLRIANDDNPPMINFSNIAQQAKSSLDDRVAALKMIIFPEYFLNQRFKKDDRDDERSNVPLMARRADKHDTYDALKNLSSQLGDIIIVAGSIFYRKKTQSQGLNVCPVLRNGQIIHRHYKDFDDGFLGQNINGYRFATKQTHPIFTVDGVRFAVDICGDHHNNEARMRNWGGKANTGAVQIHIVIGDGARVSRDDIHAAAGGYYVMTNLAAGEVTVLHSADGRWDREQRFDGPRMVMEDLAINVDPVLESVPLTGGRYKIYGLQV
jgi:predicted amidohydrolase